MTNNLSMLITNGGVGQGGGASPATEPPVSTGQPPQATNIGPNPRMEEVVDDGTAPHNSQAVPAETVESPFWTQQGYAYTGIEDCSMANNFREITVLNGTDTLRNRLAQGDRFLVGYPVGDMGGWIDLKTFMTPTSVMADRPNYIGHQISPLFSSGVIGWNIIAKAIGTGLCRTIYDPQTRGAYIIGIPPAASSGNVVAAASMSALSGPPPNATNLGVGHNTHTASTAAPRPSSSNQTTHPQP
jgi:hypothetical protein